MITTVRMNEDRDLRRRILAVDLLRGIVMMIMLLDHVREFVHTGALLSDPANPATTTVPVFFTRWITHFCAPTFVFLSGVSIYLQKLAGKTNAELSRFLLTRGLWLILLEFTLIRLLIVFNVDYSFFGMAQVIWVIGLSMIVMAALIHLPVKVVGIAGLLMIALHNLLDPIQVPPQIAFAGQPPPDLSQSLWIILHQVGIVRLGSSQAFIAYPFVPWIGVMMAGYAMGSIYTWEPEKRRKLLLQTGLAATALFILLRASNVYGDPLPWSPTVYPPAPRPAATDESQEPPPAAVLTVASEREPRPPVYALVSFLSTTKYPPSLLFLLMTLGPALILLALTDGIDGNGAWQRICINFGRVPMFFYFLQWLYAHGAGVLLGWLAGVDVSYLFLGLFEMGAKAPPNHGFSLGVTYVVWIVGLIMIYPLCAWFARVKKRNKHWALSYV